MTDTIRWVLLGVALVAALATTVLVTRHVVWGGDPTSEGSVTGVRPGADDAGALTAYHYRVTSRYGFFVKMHVADGEVGVSGPRLSPAVYAFFIGGQLLLPYAAYVLLLAAALWWDWRLLLAGLGTIVAGVVFSMVCAAGLWSLPDSAAMTPPGMHDKVTFPVSSVRDVVVGPGWDRQGIGFVLGPVVKGVDSMAGQKTVSFQAPDPTTKRYVTYAVCAYTEEEAADLARKLADE